jgi:hypothetical protein
VGDYYTNNDGQHQKNEMVHVSQHPNFIVELVFNGRKIKKKKIVAIFHLLKHGKPINDFEHIRGLFDLLKGHHTPKKHWTNSSD